MAAQDLPLELLFRVLPPSPALAGLREAILARSTADPARTWAGSATYATVDKRLLPVTALGPLFEIAEARAVDHVRAFHRALRLALTALADGAPLQAIDELVRLGDAAGADSRWQEAATCFSAASSLAAEFDSIPHNILCTRRLGRAWLHLGDLERAHAGYAHSLELAIAGEDRVGRVIGRIGLGHVLCLQGRWTDAELEYRAALVLTGADDVQLRAQLASNLSMTAREQGRLDEAAQWLEQMPDAASLDPADRSTLHNNRGLLLLARGAHVEAGAEFRRALADSPGHFDSAMILDNLAELAIRSGDLVYAETWARRAEELAIAAASPRALADVYLRLGRMMRLRADPHGVTFFEKALELARDHAYPYTEALACVEYAAFREENGDAEEAAQLRTAADSILASLGAPPAHDGETR